jgi:hypothetical protein
MVIDLRDPGFVFTDEMRAAVQQDVEQDRRSGDERRRHDDAITARCIAASSRHGVHGAGVTAGSGSQ